MKITNDQEHDAAVERMIQLERQPDSATNEELAALAVAVDTYEEAAGYIPDPPRTLRGILEVEMFKRRIRQRGLAQLLEIPESRLSELMKGKREMNLDIARRLFTKLAIPAEVVLTLAA
jgi:HTH-type transcriptional regulator/antitoxin HigA